MALKRKNIAKLTPMAPMAPMARTSSSDPSVIEARRRMRRAWGVLSVYVFIRILSFAHFEWQAVRYGIVEALDIYGIFSVLFYLVVFVASLVAFARLAVKRAFAPALIYAFIASTLIASSVFHNKQVSFEMNMKARLFAAFPHLCPTPLLPGKPASICYHYSVEITGGDKDTLVFNPGDEMSLSARQWPEGIKRMFGKEFSDEVYQCSTTRRIVDHVYWVSSDDCWKR